MNAGAAKRIHPELIAACVLPGAHQNPKVRRAFASKQILSPRIGILTCIADKQIPTLRQSRDEACVVNTPVLPGRKKHAGITRVYRKSQHAPAKSGDDVLLDRTEVGQ